MKYHLSDLISRLQKYSASLDQSAFLVDKPWVVSNGNGPLEKLIFRRDGRVHLSTDGDVKNGKWEYLPEAQSLLIDYGNKTKLYRHQYLDEAVLALKRDGSSNDDYYLLANENEIPDYDAKKYLENKYLNEKSIGNKHSAEKNIEIKYLDNGKKIELENPHSVNGSFYEKALINGKPAENGTYLLSGNNTKLVIRDGKLVRTLNRKDYQNDISIWQNANWPSKGEVVEGIVNGEITVKNQTTTFNLMVKNGKIKKVTDNFTKILISIILIIIISVALLAFLFINLT